MKKALLFSIALTIAGIVVGQSAGSYPYPVIRYNTLLACQKQAQKMDLSIEEPHDCIKVCAGSAGQYSVQGLAGSTFEWHVAGGEFRGDSTGIQVIFR